MTSRLVIILNLIQRFLSGEDIPKIKSMYYVELGNYKLDRKYIDGAINCYKRSLNHHKDNFFSYAGMAAAYLERGLFKDAICYSKKSVEIRPHVMSYIVLAISYSIIGEPNMFREYIERITEYYGGNKAAAYDELAYRFLYLGQHERAELCCREAIKLCPENFGLYNNLGKIYLAQNMLNDAREAFKKVVKLANNRQYRRYAQKEIDNIDLMISGRS